MFCEGVHVEIFTSGVASFNTPVSDKEQREKIIVSRSHSLSPKCNFCLDVYGAHRGTQAGAF